MKVTFLIQPTGMGVTLVQHETRDIDRSVGKFLKVHLRYFNHEAEWQRRWAQDPVLQQEYTGRFYDGEDMATSPVNPYDIPRLVGILESDMHKSGLVSWLENPDQEDELVVDKSKPRPDGRKRKLPSVQRAKAEKDNSKQKVAA